MMSDVSELPHHSRAVYDGVNGQMSLASDQPRRQIVGSARRGGYERERMRARFQPFASPALQNGRRSHGGPLPIRASPTLRAKGVPMRMDDKCSSRAPASDERPQREDKITQESAISMAFPCRQHPRPPSVI